jgi:hypothetical protein
MHVIHHNNSQSRIVTVNFSFMYKLYICEIPVRSLWYMTAQFMQVFV